MSYIITNETDDPPQGGACTAPNPIFANLPPGLLKGTFLAKHGAPVVKRLEPSDAAMFLQMHTETRMNLPEHQREFMKELNPALLAHLFDKNMPVIGVFVGDKMVSGCALLYPSDKGIADYLSDYDFNGQKDQTAVVSAMWTHSEHTGKGLSKMAVEQGMNLALFDGKDIFRAKVDKRNKPSLGIFKAFEFDTIAEGPNAGKFYPILAL